MAKDIIYGNEAFPQCLNEECFIAVTNLRKKGGNAK